MQNRTKLLFGIYWLVVVAELLLIYFQLNEWRWLTKSLLMPLLIASVWFMHGNKQSKFKWLMVSALVFSWLGDILLQAKDLFIPGLITFLMAHVFYIVYFTSAGKGKKGLLEFQPLIALPVLLFLLIFLMLLYPFLDTLKIPVTIYAITICTMLTLSIQLKRKINDPAAILFFHGALQFVISDSILAVNLFAFPNWVLSLCVMLSYCSAQYLLVKGYSEHEEASIKM